MTGNSTCRRFICTARPHRLGWLDSSPEQTLRAEVGAQRAFCGMLTPQSSATSNSASSDASSGDGSSFVY
ncbi:MAG: hypothetical protein RMN25_14290 [Anaerolineae bacterium]|nr:hypothetical protein [Thermoflexales bacterium]MDW8408939.1 hypothetical protein [Anaerolineae bacterium]